MPTETKDERRERLRARLAEIQAQPHEAATVETFRQRCSAEDVAKIDALTEPQVAALAELAATYAVAPECPDCGSSHSFTWGDYHGRGHCARCHWPGTAYHFLKNADLDAPCRYCEKPPGEHTVGVAHREPAHEGEPWEPVEIRWCSPEKVGNTYWARDVCRLVVLLWAHPSDVVAPS